MISSIDSDLNLLFDGYFLSEMRVVQAGCEIDNLQWDFIFLFLFIFYVACLCQTVQVIELLAAS